MRRYFLRRCLHAVIVMWGALTIVFLVVRVIPGDPAALLLGPTATRSQLAAVRKSLGLNAPLITQYGRYLGSAAHLDFGSSTRLGGSAMHDVLQDLPNTLTLAFAAMLLTIVVAFPLGIMLARRNSTVAGRSVSFFSLATQGLPQFWIGIVLILLLSSRLRLLPPSGYSTYSSLIMPAVALALPFIGWLIRAVRTAVLDELSLPYVRTARAKGLSRRRVFYGHVLPNTLVSVITIVGLLLGTFVGSAVIVEVVFAWPGVGRLLVDGITYRDYAVVEASVAVITGIYIVLNLVFPAVNPLQ